MQKIDRKLKKIEDINTYELKIKTLKKEKEDLKTYQILSDVENPMQFIDARKISDRELQQQITQICEHIFDLQNGPLCLSVLLQKTEKEYVWITNFVVNFQQIYQT